MDEQIQQILNTAMNSQTPTSSGASDPVDSILQDAGVNSQEPSDITNAQSQLGSPDDNGYCERFVEKMTGTDKHYTSAVDAWNNYVQQGRAFSDITQAPKGALIYYGPDTSNGDFGHVVVTDGKGNQIGATYNGVQMTPINDWMQQTGQKPLGFVIP